MRTGDRLHRIMARLAGRVIHMRDGVDQRHFASQVDATTVNIRRSSSLGPVTFVGLTLLCWPHIDPVPLFVGGGLQCMVAFLTWRFLKPVADPSEALGVAGTQIALATGSGLSWCLVAVGLYRHGIFDITPIQMAFEMGMIAVGTARFVNLPPAFVAYAVPLATTLTLGTIADMRSFSGIAIMTPVLLMICTRTIVEQTQAFRDAARTDERLRQSENRESETERRLVRTRAEDAEREIAQRQQADAARRDALLALADQFETDVVAVVSALIGAGRDLEKSSATLEGLIESAMVAVDGAEGQTAVTAASIQSLAAASEEMSRAITAIARRVDDHARLSGQAHHVAQAGAQRVRDLSDDAVRIRDTIALITDVSAQAKMLALNATIEAARSGEAGRGFSIVASEMKSLADRSTVATHDVTREIGAIVDRIGTAAGDIEATASGIDDVAKIAGSIATTIVAQRAATDRIERETQFFVTNVGELQRRIMVVAGGTDGSRQMTGNVAATAAGLSRQAQRLGDATAAFLGRLRAG